MDAKQLLFALLRSVICGEQLTEEAKKACASEALEAAYDLAAHHDLAHLVGQAISKLELPKSETVKKCTDAAMLAFYRYAQIDYTYRCICALLEEKQIPFIPLKGSVLREYYPEPWMRTSCDIDILVNVDVLEQAADALVTDLRYVRKGKGDHDISLFSENGVHLELHYMAVDEGRLPEAQKILATVWGDAVPAPGMQYRHCMSDEMFYFYHIAHMAKHFENGGCGIRPFLDIWILKNRMPHDPKRREKLLEDGGMLRFAQAAERLSAIWFSAVEPDVLSGKLERFTLDGGVYGNLEGNVAVQQTKQGSKLKYAISKILVPYQILKYQYPILQKHKWLMPVYQVVRWCRLLFCGGIRRSVKTLRTSTLASPEMINSTEELIDYLGL